MPVARSPTRATTRSPSSVEVDLHARHRADDPARVRHRGDLEEGRPVGALRDPAARRGTAPPRRSPAAPPRSAAGRGRGSARRRPPARPGTPGRRHRQHRVGPPGGAGVRRRAASRRRAARWRGRATTPGPGSAPPPAATRSRIDGRGGTGLPDTMSAIAISTSAPDSGRTTTRPSPHAVHTPRTSVIAGPPLGPVSPRSTRRTTTRCPTTWGPSRCRPVALSESAGLGGRGHSGILGWR